MTAPVRVGLFTKAKAAIKGALEKKKRAQGEPGLAEHMATGIMAGRKGTAGSAKKGPGHAIGFMRAGNIAAMRAEHGAQSMGGATGEKRTRTKLTPDKDADHPNRFVKGKDTRALDSQESAPVPPPSASARAAKIEEKLEHAQKRPAKKGMHFGARDD